MPRQQGTKVIKKFTRGLITEATAFQFPEDAVTEAQNCIFSSIGQITRRPGLDIETGGVEHDRSGVLSTDAYTQFVWPSVAGTGDLTFVVVQSGSAITFYDISTDTVAVSTDKKGFGISLADYVPSGATESPAQFKCSYAIGSGRLVIVNRACEPLLVEYDEELDTITTTAVEIKSRDFKGLEDGLTDTERVTSTVTALKSSNPKHYYNLLNQGWHSTTALADWDTARADLPSNADMVSLYRLSATDTFDNTLVTANSPGNTPAPKGHFILDVFAPNRTAAMVAEGFTGANVSTSYIATNLTGSSAMASLSTVGSSVFHAGLNFSTPRSIGRVIANITLTNGGQGDYVAVYAKNTLPSNATDGTVIGLINTSDGTFTKTGTMTDQISTWSYVWLNRYVNGSVTTVINSYTFYSVDPAGTEDPITYSRPSTCSFFAGRAWYAGNDGIGLNNSVFFSQIIERSDQYGKCYQTNDPTSENFTDILQSDGGVIKIPEAANIVHIGNYANALLVFATNGVWAITGSARQYFTATAFGVRRISSIGTNSNSSFVDYEGLPIWWGESGIYTIKHDPNYDAYSVENLTYSTIQSFITDVPLYNRSFVKGAYNADSKSITWVYNDSASLTEPFTYSKALQYNTISQAFYPFSIGVNDNVVPSVRGILNCKPSSEAAPPALKFFSTLERTSGTEAELFAELNDTTYADWTSYTPTDFDSYFIMGYNIEAEGTRNFQPNYVYVFMDEESDASLFMGGRFSWGNHEASNKFSTIQQCYNDRWSNRALRVSRLKVRGNGKALQLKFESESGKPFTISGWAMWETSNASV